MSSLCLSCKHALRIEGPGVERLVCRMLAAADGVGSAGDITFPVRRCSGYQSRSTPELYELEEIAWRVTLNRRTHQIGFLSPLEWRARHRPKVFEVDRDDEEPSD